MSAPKGQNSTAQAEGLGKGHHDHRTSPERAKRTNVSRVAPFQGFLVRVFDTHPGLRPGLSSFGPLGLTKFADHLPSGARIRRRAATLVFPCGAGNKEKVNEHPRGATSPFRRCARAG